MFHYIFPTEPTGLGDNIHHIVIISKVSQRNTRHNFRDRTHQVAVDLVGNTKQRVAVKDDQRADCCPFQRSLHDRTDVSSNQASQDICIEVKSLRSDQRIIRLFLGALRPDSNFSRQRKQLR